MRESIDFSWNPFGKANFASVSFSVSELFDVEQENQHIFFGIEKFQSFFFFFFLENNKLFFINSALEKVKTNKILLDEIRNILCEKEKWF